MGSSIFPSSNPSNACFQGTCVQDYVFFPNPSAILQTDQFLISYFKCFYMKLSMGKIPSLFSLFPKDSSLCSSALRVLLVVHWEWSQLLRKKLISWNNYLFRDGLYPKLISHSIFSLLDLAWLQPEAAFWGTKESTSPGSKCCGQDLFPRGCCERRCHHPSTGGFSHCSYCLLFEKWLCTPGCGICGFIYFYPSWRKCSSFY